MSEETKPRRRASGIKWIALAFLALGVLNFAHRMHWIGPSYKTVHEPKYERRSDQPGERNSDVGVVRPDAVGGGVPGGLHGG
jgi:hypothetical protein